MFNRQLHKIKIRILFFKRQIKASCIALSYDHIDRLKKKTCNLKIELVYLSADFYQIFNQIIEMKS